MIARLCSRTGLSNQPQPKGVRRPCKIVWDSSAYLEYDDIIGSSVSEFFVPEKNHPPS